MGIATTLKPYAKAVVAAAGVALTVASQVIAPDSTAGILVTLTIAMLTIFGVYRVPNAALIPTAEAAIHELQIERAMRQPPAMYTPGRATPR